VKYQVTIRGRTFDVELHGGDARVDGAAVSAVLQPIAGTPIRLLHLPEAVEALAMSRGDEGWEVQAHGEIWEAVVVDERTRRLREATGGGAGASAHVAVKAPMPGRVVRIEVEAGAEVQRGQGLVVLEAMKMENELTAPISGRVTTVHVGAGAAVAKGTVLVEVTAAVAEP